PRFPGWSDRFAGPIVVFGFGGWLLYADLWVGWLVIGVYALYKAYRFVRGTWTYLSYKSIIKDGDFAFPKRIEEVGNGFKGRRWADVVRIDSTGSLLFLGTTRSGKTESMFTVVYQMLLGSDGGPFVVYDRKDDWKEFLQREDRVVITARRSTHTLNIFEGVRDESEFDFIARSLFPKGGGSNQFFQRAARQVFTAGCKYLHREFQKEGETPTHADLIRFFRERTAEDMAEAFEEYADLTAAKAEIDPGGASEQAMGVFASVQQEIDDIFVGEFADAPGEKPAISLREYWENPDGRILLLDHPHEMGSTVDPMFRYLIDRSIQLSLENPRQADFVLDEFAQVPHLRNIEELVNVGAGRDTRVVVAIQSVSQLFKNYGKDEAKAILSGMMTAVILRLGDDESISYAREIIGTEWVEYTHRTETTDYGEFGTSERVSETKEEEEHPFARGEFTSFDPGYSVVARPDGWAAGYSPRLWGKVKERIDRAFGN
ncbi:type IV secretory system conjugative DNA transfer family protein, partial [Saliphagus infecundisoli]